MSKEASKAHALLHHAVTKAVIEGVPTISNISLSLQDLRNEMEDVILEPEVSSIILKIRIETSWDTSQEIDDFANITEVSDDSDQEDDRLNPDADKDKKSH